MLRDEHSAGKLVAEFLKPPILGTPTRREIHFTRRDQMTQLVSDREALAAAKRRAEVAAVSEHDDGRPRSVLLKAAARPIASGRRDPQTGAEREAQFGDIEREFDRGGQLLRALGEPGAQGVKEPRPVGRQPAMRARSDLRFPG